MGLVLPMIGLATVLVVATGTLSFHSDPLNTIAGFIGLLVFAFGARP